MSSEELDAKSGPSPGRVRRRRPVLRLSIQSKVMVMLLACSIASVALISIIDFMGARRNLERETYNRLTELLSGQQRAVENLFADLKSSLIVYSSSYTATRALEAFTAAFDDLARAPVDPAQRQAVINYYEDKVIKPVEKTTGVRLDLQALLPTSNAQEYLAAHYTATPPATNGSTATDDPGDGSAWTAANAQFNGSFREMVERFDYQDALLLDTRGNVVYSYRKGPDLGTNILTGPYRESNLRTPYQKAMAANAADVVWVTDFAFYQPQLDTPTAWLVSPVRDKGRGLGVMALQIPISKINRIMTADKRWNEAGMGTTTETYLVGPDGVMRSDSRLFLEDPEAYRREATAAGTPVDVVDKAIRLGGTTLVQPVQSKGLRAAQHGQTGLSSDIGYLGNRELQAHAPLTVPGSDLHWSILATRDTSEAFSRIVTFAKQTALATTALAFVICAVAALLTRMFARPIRRLDDGTKQISSGDYDVTIPVTSRDEIGDLTQAFNEMGRSLQIKERLLNEQRAENDRLLLSLMPESVVRRYRDGEQTIAEEHHDVSVVYADIAGFNEAPGMLSGDELVATVDTLLRQFDSAAESYGVERIRTLHTGYLAGCGLTVPRLDNVYRTVEFTLEMQRIIGGFDSKTGQHLSLRAGVTSGDVTSGLVGQSGTVYDMWGAAVSLAYQTYRGSAQPGIYVTGQVREILRDVWQFTPAGSIAVDGEDQPIWRLAEQP